MIKFKSFLKKDLLYFIILLILTALTQFHSINSEVIDWDESTFMIIAKDFSNGNLPYENLWDLKPPLFFIFLGTFYKIFGASLLTTRLFGDLLIFLTSIVIYLISKKIFNIHLSFVSSSIYIFLVSFNFAQPTLTEFLSTIFLLFAILLSNSKIKSNYFLIGFFVSLSIFTRTNMAIVIFYFIFKFIKNKVNFLKFSQFLLGCALPFITLSLIYFLNNKFKEFIYSTFIIPLKYTFIRKNPIEIFLDSYFGIFLDDLISIPMIVVILTFSFFLLFIFNKTIFKNFLNVLKNYEILFSIFFLVTVSIFITGKFYYHYLIQIFPFIAIFIVIFINTLPKFQLQLSNLIILVFVLVSAPLFNQSVNNVLNYNKISKNYPIESFIKYIDREKSLLAIENHIIYFYLDVYPITPIVHPNVIMKNKEYEDLLQSLERLNYIRKNEFSKLLNDFPVYIFCQINCELYLGSTYLNSYNIVHKQGEYKLYKVNN